MRRQVVLSVFIAIGIAALFRSWAVLLALVVIQGAGLVSHMWFSATTGAIALAQKAIRSH